VHVCSVVLHLGKAYFARNDGELA